MKSNVINYLFIVIVVSINTPLIQAMNIVDAIRGGGYYEEIKNLLEQRKKINNGDYSLNNATGILCLQVAIECGLDGIVKLLLECGVPVNDQDCLHQTPLHVAARYGRGVIARLLILNGGEINSKDLLGLTPLYYAIQQNNNAELIKLLVNAGASIEDAILNIFPEGQEKPKSGQRRARRFINLKLKG